MSVLTVRYEAVLKRHLKTILGEAEDRGARLPIFFAIVSANGSCIFGQSWLKEGKKMVGYLAEHDAEISGLIAPLNVMVSDTTGAADRWTIEEFNALQ